MSTTDRHGSPGRYVVDLSGPHDSGVTIYERIGDSEHLLPLISLAQPAALALAARLNLAAAMIERQEG